MQHMLVQKLRPGKQYLCKCNGTLCTRAWTSTSYWLDTAGPITEDKWCL